MVYGESDTSSSLDSLPDAVVLLILDCVADAKTLTLCTAVSRRLNSLLHHVYTVVLKPDPTPSTHSNTFSRLCHRIFKNPDQTVECNPVDRGNNAIPLKNFDEVRFLRIELPRPELELENGSLVKWSATFGSAFENCVVLAASSVIRPDYTDVTTGEYDNSRRTIPENSSPPPDETIIPESFYTNGDLKSRVVWTISSLIAASARRHSAQPIINQHKSLQSLIVKDACDQGVLRMGREQLEEARAALSSVSLFKKRTVMPDLEMKMWYAGRVEVGDGSVLIGVTLGAIRPKGKMGLGKEFLDGDWVMSVFDEPFVRVAKGMVKGRSYNVDMESF